VEEQVITLEGDISMLRCLSCGEQIDQVIMANRNHSEISRNGRGAEVDEGFSELKNATTEKRMFTAQRQQDGSNIGGKSETRTNNKENGQ
jgi:hypothetical protein